MHRSTPLRERHGHRTPLPVPTATVPVPSAAARTGSRTASGGAEASPPVAPQTWLSLIGAAARRAWAALRARRTRPLPGRGTEFRLYGGGFARYDDELARHGRRLLRDDDLVRYGVRGPSTASSGHPQNPDRFLVHAWPISSLRM
ncbi:hypothetical protein GCM10018955_43170 [Planomonospora venezuelensis]